MSSTNLALVQTLIEKLGFPIVVCCALAWAYHATVTWERETMLPAIKSNTEALERNSAATQRVEQALERALRRVGDRVGDHE